MSTKVPLGRCSCFRPLAAVVGFLVLLLVPVTACADGACCQLGIPCQELSDFDCDSLGGTFMGEGVLCSSDPCWGACCTTGFPPGCLISNSGDCGPVGATFIGLGTLCVPDPCVVPGLGSCCGAGGVPGCEVMADSVCESNGGTYIQDGIYCDQDPCIGACCLTTFPPDCAMSFDTACVGAGSGFQGVGSRCDGSLCLSPGLGACCRPAIGCETMLEGDCTAVGGSFTDSLHCTPDPCPVAGQGACCQAAACSIQTELACQTGGGRYHGDSTTCAEYPDDCGNTLELVKDGLDIRLIWSRASRADQYSVRRGRLSTLIDLQVTATEVGRTADPTVQFIDADHLLAPPGLSYYGVRGVTCGGLIGP